MRIIYYVLFGMAMSSGIQAKKVLVAGGAGFIGSHLSKRLLDLGHTVTIVDNLLTGRTENIASLLTHKRCHFIEHDIIHPIDCEVDWIFNCACPASPPRYQADPTHTLKTSVLGMMNMLELAKKYKARVLQCSTSEVYGDPKEHPQTENYWGNVNPIGIRSCYDEGKRCAETLCFDYHRQYGVDIKVVRIFNTYGPHMDPHDGRVVSNFIMKALAGQPLELYGDGQQTRSFCYVDDLINGLLLMMCSDKSITGPVNLGNPHERTVKQLAQKVIAATQSKATITYKPLPQDDPTRRKPDITQAKELLGWEPKISLDQGLEKTIAYFSKIPRSS